MFAPIREGVHAALCSGQAFNHGGVTECYMRFGQNSQRTMTLMTHAQNSYQNAWKWIGMLGGVLLRCLDMRAEIECVSVLVALWRKFPQGAHDVLVRNLIIAIDCETFAINKLPEML